MISSMFGVNDMEKEILIDEIILSYYDNGKMGFDIGEPTDNHCIAAAEIAKFFAAAIKKKDIYPANKHRDAILVANAFKEALMSSMEEED